MTKVFSSTLSHIFSRRSIEPRSAQLIKSQVRPVRKVLIQPFWMYASYALIALNAVVFFSYLLGINTAASSGYEIKKLQQNVSKYSDENKKLSLKMSEYASIADLQESFAVTGYVPVGKVTYLKTEQLTQR